MCLQPRQQFAVEPAAFRTIVRAGDAGPFHRRGGWPARRLTKDRGKSLVKRWASIGAVQITTSEVLTRWLASKRTVSSSLLAESGTGFSEKLLKSISLEPNKIAVKACPFYDLPATGRGLDPSLTAAEMKHCIWVNPSMVCEVKFTEWTRDDRLHQPVFFGIRENKNASKVVREKASYA